MSDYNVDVYFEYEDQSPDDLGWVEVELSVDCDTTPGYPDTWDTPGEPAGCMPHTFAVQRTGPEEKLGWTDIALLPPSLDDWAMHMGFIAAYEDGSIQQACDDAYFEDTQDYPEYDHDAWREMYEQD